MDISREQFENIVNEAIDSLPPKFQERMHNVAILVEDFPTRQQLGKLGYKNEYSLLGIYEGYHQSSRQHVGPVPPDKITIFRIPILQSCSTKEACRKQIISTVKHEIAHHFGSDEHGARKASRR
jgi:predicted Zn-dependent protease with MMP-like domain